MDTEAEAQAKAEEMNKACEAVGLPYRFKVFEEDYCEFGGDNDFMVVLIEG